MVSFNPDKDIPDLSGRVILVTGGNIGIGKETVLQLSKHKPAHIYLAARTESKAQAAIEEIRKIVPNAAPISFLPLDLTSFDSIKKAAAEFLSKSDRLDILINNAGIMATPDGTTKEGYEIQFGTNHVGHALLTNLLLPTLKRTAAATSPPRDVRIVNLSSLLENSAPPTNPYDFAKLKTEHASVSTFTRYGISKLANVHHASALARRHPDLKVVSIHPGVVRTNLAASGPGAKWPVFKPVLSVLGLFLTNVANGTKNSLWAATSPDVQSGGFYFPVGIPAKDTKASKNARDKDLEEQLWAWTEKELASHV
ncbi:putative oxidoreductase like protein [Verticillium longisporum]